jgi:hypothetical protein
MTEPSTVDPPQTVAPQQNAPAQQAASTVATPGTNLRPQDLMDAINAMPEKIANAIREAAPKTTAKPTTTTATKPAETATTATAPQSKSFAEWWFGG